jgi:hypothetical protein
MATRGKVEAWQEMSARSEGPTWRSSRRHGSSRRGWPEAVETDTLKEADGVTKLTVTMAFRDEAGCDRMTKHDGRSPASTSCRIT